MCGSFCQPTWSPPVVPNNQPLESLHRQTETHLRIPQQIPHQARVDEEEDEENAGPGRLGVPGEARALELFFLGWWQWGEGVLCLSVLTFFGGAGGGLRVFWVGGDWKSDGWIDEQETADLEEADADAEEEEDGKEGDGVHAR